MTVAIKAVEDPAEGSNTSIEGRALRSSGGWHDVSERCDEVELGGVCVSRRPLIGETAYNLADLDASYKVWIGLTLSQHKFREFPDGLYKNRNCHIGEVLPTIMVLTWILAFALLGSVGAIIGAAAFLLLSKGTRDRIVPFLVSYATGTLLGAALLGLLPQAIEQGGLQASLGSVFAGLTVFFSLERLMIWRHCHHGGS